MVATCVAVSPVSRVCMSVALASVGATAAPQQPHETDH